MSSMKKTKAELVEQLRECMADREALIARMDPHDEIMPPKDYSPNEGRDINWHDERIPDSIIIVYVLAFAVISLTALAVWLI